MNQALTVDEALARILAGAQSTPSEQVGLLEAANRTLAEPLTAAVLGLLVLGEPALASTIGGILAILFGLLVLARES